MAAELRLTVEAVPASWLVYMVYIRASSLPDRQPTGATVRIRIMTHLASQRTVSPARCDPNTADPMMNYESVFIYLLAADPCH